MNEPGGVGRDPRPGPVQPAAIRVEANGGRRIDELRNGEAIAERNNDGRHGPRQHVELRNAILQRDDLILIFRAIEQLYEVPRSLYRD